VCNLFAPPSHMRNTIKNIIAVFEAYFHVTYHTNLWYVPEVVCNYCYRCLLGWKNKSHKIKFVTSTIWLWCIEHGPELCYFCATKLKTSGFRYSIREKIDYINVECWLRNASKEKTHAWWIHWSIVRDKTRIIQIANQTTKILIIIIIIIVLLLLYKIWKY